MHDNYPPGFNPRDLDNDDDFEERFEEDEYDPYADDLDEDEKLLFNEEDEL